MDWPLSGCGYGPALFPHLLSPDSLSLMCETGMLSWVHGDTFIVFAVQHLFLPLVSLDLFSYFLWS